jgi:hypothetical protein
MPAIIAVFVQNIKKNSHGDGQTDGQTADIDQTVPGMAAKRPPRYTQIVKKHKRY